MRNRDPRSRHDQPDEVPQLYSRAEAARRLGGVSINTLKRLEQQGLLRPIRLSRSPSASAFYRAEDLVKLIEEGEEPANG